MNEYACMQLAGLAGVNVAQCRPTPTSMMADYPELVSALGAGTRFLAVDRFDRGPSSAVHMEDACQLLTLMPNQKYAGAKDFMQTVSRAKDLWPNALQEMAVPDAVRVEIEDRLNTLPLAGGAKS